jgi:diguanylate cyclase (GGDEF)-like protein
MARMEREAERLFGPYGPRLIRDPQAGGSGARFALEAHGERLGEIALSDDGPIPADIVELVTLFAEHGALALYNARRLDEHEHRSRRDALTGLRNYREFRETLGALLSSGDEREARQLSLVVIDLDHFKDVNDRHGHAAGDRLLRSAAAALTAVCRVGDRAFRIGGDEFALVLPGADRGQARIVAERAQAAIDRLAGAIGASWGVAATPADGVTRDELMAAADSAMYKRKRPDATAALTTGHTRRRLAMVARLTTFLTQQQTIAEIASAAVDELHGSFGYFLAVIQRLDDEMLRVVAAAGPLTQANSQFLAREQPLHLGINGRVARTQRTAIVPDTRLDPDYLAYDLREDPGSEVSVPISLDGRVWGVLNLEQIAAFGFDESDVCLAEAVAAVTAAAIHRCATVTQLRGLLTEPPVISLDTA